MNPTDFQKAGIAAQVAQNTGIYTGDPSLQQQWNAANAQQTQAQQDGINAQNAADAAAALAAQRAAAQTAALKNNQVSQLQTQLGGLDQQQNIGLQNLDNSFNLGANRLDQQNAVAQRNYDQQGQYNQQNYLNTKNGIQQNARATNNSLQRLLGLNGAGNSSAAYEQAPYATALQASTNLNGAQTTYGQNQGTLDTNWQDTQRSYRNSLDDLNNQKYQQQNSLKSSIASTRASLLSGIQQANGSSQYQSTINDLLSQITGLGQQYANPVLRTADVAYKAPDLSQYNLDGNTAISQGGGAASSVDPTFLSLLTDNQKRDQYGNLIQA